MVFIMKVSTIQKPLEDKPVCNECKNRANGVNTANDDTRGMFHKFNDETTFHGVRYAFGNKRTCRQRIIWTILIVSCVSILVFDVAERIQYYISSPVTVNIVSKQNDSIVFPAVTICNQNAFRRTLAIHNDHFNVISGLFEDEHLAKGRMKVKDMHLSLKDLYVRNAHQKEDMIVRCKWKGELCSAANFTATLTRYGQCYTFNGLQQEKPLMIESSGVDNGLDLIINSEEYDYMVGPHTGGGIKVLLHQQEEFPLPAEYGHELPTGRHGFMDVSIKVESMLPYPHGYCKDTEGKFLDTYINSRETCMRSCENKILEETCGCRNFYLPEKNNTRPICAVKDWLCMQQAADEFRSRSAKVCRCSTPCSQMSYEPTMSYGSISDFSSNQLMSINTNRLQSRFQNSREKAFKYEEEYRTVLINHKELEGSQLPAFYKMLMKFESMDKNMVMCTKEVNKFDDAYFSPLISQLAGSHPVFRMESDVMKMVDRGPFGVSNDKIKEFVYSLHSQLMVINKTKEQEDKKYYFKMILETLDEKIDLAGNLSRLEFYMSFILWAYPNIWIRNFTDHAEDDSDIVLQNSLMRQQYSKPILIRNDSLTSIIELSRKELKHFRKIVRVYRDTGILYEKRVNVSSMALIAYVQRYKFVANIFKDWYQDDVLANFHHLAQVLDYIRSAHRHIMSDLKKDCNSVYYIKNIRRTSNFLSMCTSKLGNYIRNQGETMNEVASYFLMRDMTHFMEGVRTFATNTFSDLRMDMNSSDCLLHLLLSYRTLIYWQTKITKLPGSFITKHECYKNAGTILADSRSFSFNVSHWYDVLSTINNLVESSKLFSDSMKIDKNFYRDKFLHLNILFHNLNYQEITQQEAYDIFGLLGDVGGAMGLFIGASVLTVFEVIDFISEVFNKAFFRTKKKNKVKTIHVQSSEKSDHKDIALTLTQVD